ncbi:MAG: (deoxy)nucleoside triphosphate pyrophosphohydrolase [Bacteroidota bacterium]
MIRVACAIIRNEDNEVLVVQRGEKTDHPFKWEFPGGKLGKDETEEECIIREIREELAMDIIICSRLEPVEHDYGHKKIRLIPFVCDTLEELPVLSEHIDFRWVPDEKLGSVDLCEADIRVASEYMKLTGNKVFVKEQETEGELSAEVEDELKKMINNMMSLKEAEWVANSAGEDPVLFRKLLDYSFSSGMKLAFRASWALSKVIDKHPDLILPYLDRLIDSLDSLDNESTQRSFLRILSMTDLNLVSQRHQGILADHCFRALNSGFSAIAIKAYSMEVIYRLALIYPELAHELAASINLLQGEGSAGIKARGSIILRKLMDNSPDMKKSKE